MEELFSSSVCVLPLGLWVSGGSLVALSFSSLHSRCQPLVDQGCSIVRNCDLYPDFNIVFLSQLL